MSNDIDLAADFADSYPDTPVLPPLEELYGSDALPADVDLDAMIAIATDPNTPAVDEDLIPHPADDLAQFADSDDDILPTPVEHDAFEEPTDEDNPFGQELLADDSDIGIDDLDAGI